MFSNLGNYMDKDFLYSHIKFKIYTPNGDYEASIFSIYSIGIENECHVTQSTSQTTTHTFATTSVTNPTSQSSSSQNNKQEETKTEQKVERCTNNKNHGMNIGNSGKWFNSKNYAIAYYNQQIKYWGDQWENNKIDNDTYYKNCPSGYEVWDCMYCGKWTINFYYR